MKADIINVRKANYLVTEFSSLPPMKCRRTRGGGVAKTKVKFRDTPSRSLSLTHTLAEIVHSSFPCISADMHLCAYILAD